MPEKPKLTHHVLAIARGTLHDRRERRLFMGRFTLFLLAFFAIGLWGIGTWLEQSLFRMLLYWFICAFMCLMLLLFALYDALAVMREERDKIDEE